MAKLFKLLIGIPIAVVILAFALANRQDVSVSLDPFSAEPTLVSPLYILLFLTLLVGVVVGGVATWFTQGRIRRRARLAEDAADRWRAEAERARALPQPLVPSPATGRGLVRSDYA
ncbi:hypothetical protein RHAL1_04142 [Beijerinckiaceae bacterium RH AL1]|nr:lipopolysaccharide assembly protein LapA domain-containing protein [Beijerinckiaceae bacterium]VVB50030.1 hypothetical protein RHCH11_RHCH11_04064 [Beijerinckiaceae bacterium RH CH11]VVB50111.1 hypothetical protein RHAL8_04061 [Beijerinckiaceae bacterium RH AL8]VVC57202.1 hypothetical protein RHAL1_04142 [Beijerinckiaceae bacterium RH AL1]